MKWESETKDRRTYAGVDRPAEHMNWGGQPGLMKSQVAKVHTVSITKRLPDSRAKRHLYSGLWVFAGIAAVEPDLLVVTFHIFYL